MEKPGSPARAKEMLARCAHTASIYPLCLELCLLHCSLSGQEHVVYTGLALVWRAGEKVCHETTHVTFAPLSFEVISSYVASGEPL